MTRDTKMVAKGRNVPLAALLDQAGVTIKLGQEVKLAPELAKFGFSSDDSQQMTAIVAELSTDRSRAIEARTAATAATATERAKRSEAKRVKRLLVSAAKDLFAQGKITEVDRKAFNAGGTLGVSTPAASKYLGDIRGVVVRLAPLLTPLLGGEDPVNSVDCAKTGLDGAESTQEVAVGALPAETAAVFEGKGKLLTLIERQNSTATRAFDGNALLIGRFNKDLILRAVRARPAKVEEPTVAAPK